MRKFILIIIALLFIISLINIHDGKEEIRVRIIPNSNSGVDLSLKEKAKSITCCYLNKVYDSNYNECINNIKMTMDEFEDVLTKEIGKITISFDKHTLYNKTYNDNAVKNEKYYTLYIVIGDGKGSNWWGTIYPNLLEISSSDEIKYESLFVNLFK